MAEVDPLVIEEISWLNMGIDADIPIPVTPVSDSWSHPMSTKSMPIDIPSSSASRTFPTRSFGEDMDIIRDESDFATPLLPMSVPPSLSPLRPPRSQRPLSTHTLPISQSAPSDIYISSLPSTPLSPIPPPKPAYRSEWLYRRPNYPRMRPATSPPPTKPMSPTATPTQPLTNFHGRSVSADQQDIWPTTLRPRYRGGRSMPALETTTMRPPTKYRSSSISSVSSSTNASSSSRPETPVSPGSRCRHRYLGPSKSILTRTSSNATKNSSMSTSCNKSVKFVEMPTIHHASVGYWDMDDDIDMDSTDSCIREDDEASIDVDARATPSTPKKKKTNGIAKFLQRKMSPTSSRPSISGPFALGSIKKLELSTHELPPLPFVGDGSSIRSVSTIASISRSSSLSSSVPLRPAPSLESFRSVRSTGARSTRSLGSIRSTGSTGKFRSWLARMGLNFRTEMGCTVS